MLDSIFMQILDMSNTASIVILVVLLARLLLKKAPKVFSYALWAVVLFRLLCPVTFEAPVSIMPEMASVSQDYSLSEVPISVLGAAEAAYHAVGDAVNGGLGVQDIRTTEKDEEGRTKYVGSLWWDVWILFGQYVWVAGMGLMLLYSAVSYLKIRKKLLVVVPLRDDIFLADDIKSPFVVGLFCPKIYLPCNLDEKEQAYIILHEQYHIKRLDHIIKALAFLALAIHWFNPLVWVAFTLASKDMEMSCDEAVIGKIGGDVRADYSASLLTLATGRRIIAGTPLAFGEGDTKSRIRNLANWRKPVVWVVLIAAVACIALAVCLLIDPDIDRELPMNGSNVSELDTEQIIDMLAKAEKLDEGSQPYVGGDIVLFDSDFTWMSDDVIRYYYFKGQEAYSGKLQMFPDKNRYFITKAEEHIMPVLIYRMSDYLNALKYMPQEEIRQLYPDAEAYVVHLISDGSPSDYEHAITYTQNGIEDIDGWYIHLMVSPTYEAEPGGYYGSDEELLHLFYGNTDHQGYGGTLHRPDGTVITFPVDKGTESAAYADFAARFSEKDILFNTDSNGKILLSEDFVGSRYVCFSMKTLDDAEGVPYPDIEDHIVSVDVAERWIENPQPGTIYVLGPSIGNVSEADPETSREMLGPYLFDLPLYGRMDAEKGFAKHYVAGTTVRISGEWRGDYPLSFVFSGEHTNEDVITVVHSGSSKTITLPTDDDWTCSVTSNGGRTDGDFWLYVSE